MCQAGVCHGRVQPVCEELPRDAFFPFACLQCICASSQAPASLPAQPGSLGAELFVSTRAQKSTLARPLHASASHSDAHVQEKVTTREGGALPKATQLGRQSSGSRSTGDSCTVTPPLTRLSSHWVDRSVGSKWVLWKQGPRTRRLIQQTLV